MGSIIDTTGLSCPQPMLMVKQMLEKCTDGTVTVLADCDASRENITRISKQLGWKVEVTKKQDGVYELVVHKER